MIDFSRTFCDLHPNELISNFCCKEECNIGLCATCICSHTESHIQRKTAPDYQNIRTTYSKMQENIRTRISAFENEKTRINNLVEIIQNKRKQIADSILQTRQDTIDFVNRFFDAKQKELIRKIQADEKKLGLHNENRMDSLSNLISREISTLFSSAQDLNSQNFLESFLRIRTQVVGNSLQTQRQISDQLDKNENYQTIVSINSTYINEVKIALERSITVNFADKSFLIKPVQVREQNRNSRLMVNPSNEVSVMTMMPKRNAQSLPKNSFVAPSRFTSQIIEPYTTYYSRPTQQPQQQAQQTQQQQQSSQLMRKTSEPYIINNSISMSPIQGQSQMPNYSSTIEMRGNSSQKNIKQNNQFSRMPMAQSFLDCNYNQAQLDASKKIRRSGLTILKSCDNETKNQA